MNKLIALTLCLFLSATTFSQREYSVDAEKMESIKAKKIAFITDELSLTPKQAEKFWPLYNEFTESNKEQRRGKGKRNYNYKKKSEEDFKSMSDEQAAERLSEILQNEEEKLQAKKEYVEKLKSVLDTKQILQLLRAERKFKRNIFRDYKRKVRVIEMK